MTKGKMIVTDIIVGILLAALIVGNCLAMTFSGLITIYLGQESWAAEEVGADNAADTQYFKSGYHVAMHGGIGSTATTEELSKRGYPQWFHQKFIDDCREMAYLDIDICLASHPNQTNFLTGVNLNDRNDFSNFVDKTVWRNLLLCKADEVERKG